MIDPPVGGDDEVGAQPDRGGLDQDVGPPAWAASAGRVADHPAHRVAGGDRNQGLARLERDRADPLGRGVEPIERPFHPCIDLDRVHIALAARLANRRAVRGFDALDGRSARDTSPARGRRQALVLDRGQARRRSGRRRRRRRRSFRNHHGGRELERSGRRGFGARASGAGGEAERRADREEGKRLPRGVLSEGMA